MTEAIEKTEEQRIREIPADTQKTIHCECIFKHGSIDCIDCIVTVLNKRKLRKSNING